MYRRGHIGLSLLILSPFINTLGLEFVALSVFFSIIPDLDVRLGIRHRGITHNITFAAFLTVVLCYILYIFDLEIFLSFSAFVGIVLHLIGDLITHQKFAPLYPFVRRRIAFKIVKSNNRFVNDLLLLAGTLTFTYFYIFAKC